jgi:hypothetical protein
MKRPEEALQRAIIRGLRLGLPHGFMVHHSPNGGKRSKVEGAIFKALGTVPGWPDITIMGVRHFEDGKPLEAPEPVCCFMEVKAMSGRLTDAQMKCHDRLTDLGFKVAVVRSWNDVVDRCRAWQLPLRVSA